MIWSKSILVHDFSLILASLLAFPFQLLLPPYFFIGYIWWLSAQFNADRFAKVMQPRVTVVYGNDVIFNLTACFLISRLLSTNHFRFGDLVQTESLIDFQANVPSLLSWTVTSCLPSISDMHSTSGLITSQDCLLICLQTDLESIQHMLLASPLSLDITQ